jgi:putative tricarboxylic transport membrane protein
MMKRVNIDHLSSLFWLSIGIYVAYESKFYGVGSLTDPGPGFLLFYSGIGLAGLSCLVFINQIIKRDSELLSSLWSDAQWLRPTLCFLTLVLYTLFVDHLGFFLTAFITLSYLFTIGRTKRKFVALPIALMTVLVTYLVFVVLLESQQPSGTFWR